MKKWFHQKPYNIPVWKIICKILKRIFKMQVIPTAPNLNAKMRKFKFIVMNSGQDGMSFRMNEQPQIGIAPSPQYLINLYAQSGDKIRILEELPADNETQQYGKIDIVKMTNQNSETGWAAKGDLGAGTMIAGNISDEQLNALNAMHGGKSNNQQPPQPPQQPQVQQNSQTQPQVQSQPTYFKIGSIECKMENGKVYQKQWMRVSETEMANYRLISDKNNKILPMDGKHLEVLKWAISEDEASVQ